MSTQNPAVKRALTLLRQVVPARTAKLKPILGQAMLTPTGPATVTATVTDCEVRITVPMPLELAAPRCATVATWATSGMLPPAGFDTLLVPEVTPARPAVATMTMPTAELRRILATCEPAMATEETRYAIAGVRLAMADGKAMAGATDGRRLTVAHSGVELPDTAPCVVVPRVRLLLAFLAWAEKAGADRVVVSWDDRTIRVGASVRDGAAEYVSQLVAVRFHDFYRVIPQAKDIMASALVDRAQFLSAARQLARTSKADMAAQPDDDHPAPVCVTIGAGQITLSIETKHAGSHSETIPAVSKATAEAYFNAVYLVDAAETFVGPTLKMALCDDGCPALFRSGDEPALHVLMPFGTAKDEAKRRAALRKAKVVTS